MWICPNCGVSNENEHSFCSSCGVQKPMDNQETLKMEPVEINNENSNVNMIDNDKNNKTLSILIGCLVGLIIICLVCCGIFLYSNNKSPKHEEAIPVATEAPETISGEADVAEDTSADITSIYFTSGTDSDTITIYTTGETNPDVYLMEDPDRLVLDFYDSEVTMSGVELAESGVCFDNIRYANHDGYARVVIDLSQDCTYGVDRYNDKCIINLNAKNPVAKTYSGTAEITDIYNIDDGISDEIHIKIADYAAPEVSVLSNPDRLVLDFYGSTNVMSGTELNQAGSIFNNIRYANHDGYTRIVIDLPYMCKYNVIAYNTECVVFLK